MNLNSDTKAFCLIGRPVSKSLSPYIHNYIFNENQINAKYLAFDISEDSLKEAVEGIKALKIKGFNVTAPYKVKIIKYIDEIDKEASLIGAVNTVLNLDGKLIGYNTDGRGFFHSLKKANIDITNKNILIIGAGGAARAIAINLSLNGANKIKIVNRTVDKAKELANYISYKFPQIKTSGDSIKNVEASDIDIVINCTSVGMYPYGESLVLNPCVFNKTTTICDIVYKPLYTKFLSIAKKNGYKVITGIDMLLYQGILSNEIWLNKRIDVESIERIRRKLNNIVE